MLRAHALDLPDFSNLCEEQPEVPVPRPALAGGSSRRPPDDGPGSAQIIPFPDEPRRPKPQDRDSLHPWPVDGNGEPEPEQPARDTAGEPLWPYWMAHVLTRYRAPDGSGGGGPGVFI